MPASHQEKVPRMYCQDRNLAYQLSMLNANAPVQEQVNLVSEQELNGKTIKNLKETLSRFGVVIRDSDLKAQDDAVQHFVKGKPLFKSDQSPEEFIHMVAQVCLSKNWTPYQAAKLIDALKGSVLSCHGDPTEDRLRRGVPR